MSTSPKKPPPRVRPQKLQPPSQYAPLRKPLNPHPLPPPPRRPLPRDPKWFTGIAVFVFSTYGFYIYTTYRADIKDYADRRVPVDVSDRYDKTASSFDSTVDWTENLMGLGSKRKKLAREAKGHVLEVSVGTGRNFEYLDLRGGVKKKGGEEGAIKTLTFVDQSAQMLAISREKFRQRWPGWRDRAVFITQDASQPLASLLAPEGFDTIVQTMGLCSTPNPEALLRNLGKMVNQDGGRILLLEHGRAHYDWVNTILDNLAPAHADRHGCWWNKDIGAIVSRSGLKVVEIRRYNFGTTWWVELRPM